MEIDVKTTAEVFQPEGLSGREAEVLMWLAKGKANSEIGMILNISTRTVSKHLEHVYSKLGVESRIEAVVHLMQILHGSQVRQQIGLA